MNICGIHKISVNYVSLKKIINQLKRNTDERQPKLGAVVSHSLTRLPRNNDSSSKWACTVLRMLPAIALGPHKVHSTLSYPFTTAKTPWKLPHFIWHHS